MVASDEFDFCSAVREHEATLGAMARKLCGNDADADDLVQETYERALRSLDRYTDRGNLRSWLAAILHNLFIDRCRKLRRSPRTEQIDRLELPSPEPVAAPTWTRITPAQIAAALDEVSVEIRLVFELHSAGRSYNEIAAELRIPKNTVGTRLVRGRKKLRQALLRSLA
jgi:RNA polymerase sigma-70 factor (ECF subfamily)